MNVADLFIEIVQIDSESFYEQKMSEYVQQFLRERKVDFHIDNLNQIYAHIPGDKEPILFSAHMDTVSPGKGIKPSKNQDGKIVTDGTTVLGGDNKGTLAVLLWLIDKLTSETTTDRHAVEFIFTVQEEVVPSGASQLGYGFISAKVGFIFDKGNEPLNSIVMSAPYINDLTIEFTGRAAHASRSDLGINALLMLNSFLNEIKVGVPYQDATLNLGVIAGGDGTNTVPSKIKVSGDYRANSQAVLDQITADLEKAKQAVLAKFAEGRVEVSPQVYCKGYIHELSDNLSRLERVYQDLGFSELLQLRTQAGSDACAFNNLKAGLEVFNLGSGVHLMHSVNEYTTAADLQKLTEIVAYLTNQY